MVRKIKEQTSKMHYISLTKRGKKYQAEKQTSGHDVPVINQSQLCANVFLALI